MTDSIKKDLAAEFPMKKGYDELDIIEQGIADFHTDWDAMALHYDISTDDWEHLEYWIKSFAERVRKEGWQELQGT